jgi:aquaporin Z
VSVAVSIVGKQAWSKTIGYIFAQLSGGLLGVLVAHILSGKILVVAPAPETLLYQGILAEGLFTFALVSAVLHTAVSHKAAGNSYFGMAIGLTVLIGAFSVGTLSGGAFNPAVGIAPLLYGLVTSKVFVVEHLIMYIVGPLMGAVLAAQFYQLTHAHEKHE